MSSKSLQNGINHAHHGNIGHARPNINTSNLPSNPVYDNMSQSVRQVAEHASDIRVMLERVKAVADIVGQEFIRIEEMTSVARFHDEVVVISRELEEARRKKGEEIIQLISLIEAVKIRLTIAVDDHIHHAIRDCVAKHVTHRLQAPIETGVHRVMKDFESVQLRNNDYKVAIESADAKGYNATVRPKFWHEFIRPVEHPIFPKRSSTPVALTPRSAYTHFPTTFQDLLTMTPEAVKDNMSKFKLEESRLSGEEGRLDNINRLMSHLGIGYRLNLGSPYPILTSLWDR